MTTFNLEKFIKEAMADWGVYRTGRSGEYIWWSMDDIEKGSRSFEKWKTVQPTIKTAYLQAKSFEIKKTRAFSFRYGISPDEVKKFFKVYVGYNPTYGAYMCSVGPYISNKPKEVDRKNRFSYFTQKYQSIDEKSLTASFKKYCSGSLDPFKDSLGMGDFGMSVAMGDSIDEKSGNVKWKHVNMPNLANEDAQRVIQRGPIQGIESKIYLNNFGKSKVITGSAERNGMQTELGEAIDFVAAKKGQTSEQVRSILFSPQTSDSPEEKIIIDSVISQLEGFFHHNIRAQAQRGGWNDVLEEAVNTVASKRGLQADQIWHLIETNSSNNQDPHASLAAKSLNNDLAKQLTKLKKSIVKRNQPRKRDTPDVIQEKQTNIDKAQKIVWMPTSNELSQGASGQQIPIVLQTRTVQKSMLKLQDELLQLIVSMGTNDLQAIADVMSGKRKNHTTVAQGKVWTTQDIQAWIDYFDQMRHVSNGQGGFVTKSYRDLLNENSVIMSDVDMSDAEETNENTDGSDTTDGVEEIAESDDGDSSPADTAGKMSLHGSYPDFDSACNMASLYFHNLEHGDVDTGTRGIKNASLYQTPTPIFARDEDVPNIDSNKLTDLRSSASDKLDKYLSNFPNASRPSDISAEEWKQAVGKKTAKPESSSQSVAPTVTPTVVTPEIPANQTEVTEVTPKEEEVIEDLHHEEVKLSNKILDNLIKIAKNLSHEGKTRESDEINMIIKKYKKE